MKTLKLIYVALILVVFASCSKESIEETELLSGKAQVEFYENVHTNITQIEGDILYYINDHREKNGLQRLEKDFTVQKYTDSHTEYMISKGKISHDLWDARVKSLLSETNGYGAGENVAYGYNTGLQAVIGWLGSEGHLKNIENPEFTHTAVTAKLDKDGNYYFTQIFLKK